MVENDNHPDDADAAAQPEPEPTPERSRREFSDGQGEERARDGDAEAEQSASSEADPEGSEDETAASDSNSSGFRGIRLRELSGPQACLTIVGCGTLAALLVVALVYGGIRMVASSIAGDEGDEEGPGLEQSGEPVEDLAVGGLDLCGRIIPGIAALSLERTDEGASYVDTAESDVNQQRMVSDHCSWVVRPPETPLAEWEFDLEYQAIVDVVEENQMEGLFEEYAEDVPNGFSDAEETGSLNQEYPTEYTFGLDPEGENQRYVVVVLYKSVAYEIVLNESPTSTAEEEVPTVEEFEAVVDPIMEQVNIRLDAVIPQ